MSNKNSKIIFLLRKRLCKRLIHFLYRMIRKYRETLFLAFQNIELMIEKIGENKFFSLYKNLKKRYLYKNIGIIQEYELSTLKTFEYYLDQDEKSDISTAKAIFIIPNKLFAIELKYQKMIKLHDKYNLSQDDKKMILQYDEHIMSKNKLYLIDKNQQKHIREFFDKQISKDATDAILRIFENGIDEDCSIDLSSLLEDLKI